MSDVTEQAAPVEEQAPIEEATTEQPEQTASEDDFAEVIEVPDSSAENGKVSLVPLAAVKGARAEIKELKQKLASATEGSARAQQLEARLDELSAQLAQLGPKAQAYDAAVAAQNQRPREDRPEDDQEAVELAQVLDLYTAEGKPDIAKARKTLALMDKRAQVHSRAAVEPLANHTISQQSRVMLDRAKNTAAPNGQKPDPKTLESIWARLDPRLTATPDGAKQAWAVALGYSAALAPAGQTTQRDRTTDGKFAKAELPAPLHTEKAGGRDVPDGQLDAADRKYIKDTGMTEKEFLEAAARAPWLRR